jgi:hypothetical protein
MLAMRHVVPSSTMAQTMWMSLSCSPGDMIAASTPYGRRRLGPGYLGGMKARGAEGLEWSEVELNYTG